MLVTPLHSAVLGRRWWHAGGAGLLAVAAVIALLAETAGAMVLTWESSATFNHGFLILPVVGYLVWIRRDRLLRTVPAPAWSGLVGIVFAAVLWTLGYVTSTMVVQQFALVAAVQAAVLAVLGWPAVRVLLFPLFYLYFAVPFGEELVPYLQDVTAFFVVKLLQQIGIPVFVDGVFISIPTGNFLVAEACAGLRFLIASIALGAVFANVTYHSAWRRAAFMVLSVAVPIVANGIRAFGIVLIAHLTNNQVAVGVDHIVYGWVFFTIVTVLLLALGMAMRERGSPILPESMLLRTAPAAAPLAAIWIAAVAAVGIVGATSGYAQAAMRAPAVAAVTPALPTVAAPWRPVAASPAAGWQPQFAGPDATLHRSYVSGSDRVELHAGHYAVERQGAKAVTAMHRFVDDASWHVAGSGRRTIMLDGRATSVVYLRMAGPGARRLVWYWYAIGGEQTGDPYRAKLLKAKAVLWQRDPSASIIAIATDYGDRMDEASERLAAFAAALGAPAGQPAAGK